MTLKEAAHKSARMVVLLGVLIVVGGAAVFIARGNPSGILGFAVGAIIGTGANIAVVFYMKHSVERAVEMTDPLAAANHMRLHSLLRLGLVGGSLAAAHFLPLDTAVLGALAVVFNVKIASYAQLHFMKKSDSGTQETHSEIQGGNET